MTTIIQDRNLKKEQHVEYLCDAASEIASLPTHNANDRHSPAIGSTALVVATKDVYILSPSNTWTKLYTVGAGGSGSLAVGVATISEIDAYVGG